MKCLSALLVLLISSISLAAPLDDPCSKHLGEHSHNWRDLRIKPIKIIRLDECVIGYADAETIGVAGDSNTLFITNDTQVLRAKGDRNGVFTTENVKKKGLKEGQVGVVTYCEECRFLCQIILEK